MSESTDVVMTELSAEQVLTTTRAVRRALDLSRPIEPAVIRRCLEIALQAPSGSNSQLWQFVVVTDPGRRRALAEIYNKAFAIYRESPMAATRIPAVGERQEVQARVMSSAEHLAAHLHDVPVHVVPCFAGRFEGEAAPTQAAVWGSIMPATWSFMLAARAHGLGTSLTTMHLIFEEEAADVLGIPFASYTQAALVPVAHSSRHDFKPAHREPVDGVLHWDEW